MSKGFNLTAELNLRGPSNIGTVVADIRRQLGTVTANVNVRVDPAASRNIATLNQNLNQLNITLRNTAAFAGASTTSIQNFTRAVQAAVTASANLPNNLSAAANATNTLTQNANQASRATNQITNEFQEFGRQAGLAVRRFAAFATVTGAIYKVSNAISSASKEFLDFNRELVRVSQVTDTSVKFLDGLVNRISSLSTGLGVSSKELIMVSSTLAQAGLTAKDTEKALRALALSALAPSFDSMNETVEGSIALMRQFGISAGDLEKALGSVNAVAAKFAVEASDIITAIQRTGGVFATASKGVAEGTEALNQFIAVFTSVRATTRESAETIATGLRTIFTRIQRADTIDALKAYGVALTDLSGKFVGPYEAVRRLSEGLSQLDPRDLKFSRIVEELGGFRQIGKVIPLIQQLSVTQQAYAVAQRGQASLVNDAATAQQALAIRMTKVREEFIAMVRSIGQSEGFQTFVNLSLDLASALIKIADSAKGALPALTAIAAIRGAGFVTQFATGFVGGLRRRHDGGPIHKFARGGVVPGSGDGDTVPAMLEPGEFVIRKRAVQAIGAGQLSRMNKFAVGGPAEYPSYKNRRKYVNAGEVKPLTTQEKLERARSQNISPTAVGLLRDLGGGLSEVGAAVLQPQSRSAGDISFNISSREIQNKVGQKLKNLPFVGSKTITGRIAGLSQRTSNSFNSALDEGIVSGINLAATRISQDLEIPIGQITESTKSSFLSGINTGTRGNLFEDILTLMSGKFERAASRNFDFPNGVPTPQAEDFLGLPNKWVDAKASFERARRSGEGSLKEKTLNEIRRDILAQKKKYFDISDASIPESIGASPEGALTAAQLLALRKDKVTSKGNFYLDQANTVLRKSGLPTVKAAQLTKVGRMSYNIPGYAAGGSVEDTVPALLTPGEFVINKKAAQHIGLSRLHKLNHADKVKGFNKGGPVGVQTFATGGEAFDDPALDNQARRMAIEIMKTVGVSAKEALTQARQQVRDSLVGPLGPTSRVTPQALMLPDGSVAGGLKRNATPIAFEAGGWTDTNIESIQQQRLRRRAAQRGADITQRSAQGSFSDFDIQAQGGVSSSSTLSAKYVNNIINQQQQKQSGSWMMNVLKGGDIFGRAGAASSGAGGLVSRMGSGLMSKMGGLGNAGMTMAFMGPMIGEGVSKLIGGKQGAGVGGAVSNFSSAFAVGSQFGAPGAIIGALAGLVSAIDGYTHGIVQHEDELSKSKIETESNKASKNIEALGKNPRDTAATQALVKNAQVIASEEQKRMENAAKLRKPGMISNALQSTAEYASFGLYKRAEPDKAAIAAEEAAINKTSQEALMSAISAKVAGGIDFKTAVSQVGGGNSDFVKQQIAEADANTKAKLNEIEERRSRASDPETIKILDEKRKALINASFMEQTAIQQAAAAEQEKAKKAKALSVAMNQASVSIARTFSNMNQSLNVASLKISEASNSIEEIISGKSSLKSDFASQKAILENPGAFSDKERQGAIKQVSGFFGQDEKFVRGLSDFGANAQDTITKIASAAQQSGSDNAAEDISRSLTDQLIRTFGDNRITESMRQQISNSIKSQTEKGEGIDPQKLIDEADGLKALIDANKQALETTLKIYSTVGDALNMYADAVEKASDLQNKVVERNAALANTLAGLDVKVKELFGRRVTVDEKISGRMTEATMRAGVQPGQLNPATLLAQRAAFAQQQQAAKQNFENAKKGDIANPAVISQITKAASALAEWNRKLISTEQSIENLPGVIQSNIDDILSTVSQKIAERESMVQAGATFAEKLVTSTPQELQGLNSTFNLLNNTLAGNITTFQNSAIAQKAYNDAIMSGSSTMEAMSAAQTAFANENKNAMSMFSEMIQISGLDKSNPDKARNMRADLLENFARAQGMNVGNNPMFNQMIAALRAKPEDNPEIKALMDMYETQKKALIDATQAANQLLVDKQAQVLTTAGNAVVEALKGVTVKFDEAQLRMMGLNIQRPGNVMGRADGGIVYASSGKFIPRGTDTVPAMLSPGEFVVNSRATKNNLPLLSAINRSSGGITPEYLATGTRDPITGRRNDPAGIAEANRRRAERFENVATSNLEYDQMTPAQRRNYDQAKKLRGQFRSLSFRMENGRPMFAPSGQSNRDFLRSMIADFIDSGPQGTGIDPRTKLEAESFPYADPNVDYSPSSKPSMNLRRDSKALASWVAGKFKNSGGLRGFGKAAMSMAGNALTGAARFGLSTARGMGIGLLAGHAAQMMGFNNVDPSMVGAGSLAAESLLYGGANAANLLTGSAGSAATMGGRFVAGAGAVAVPAVAFNTGLSFLTEGASALYSLSEGNGRYSRGLEDEMVDDTRNGTGMIASGVKAFMNPARAFVRGTYETRALIQDRGRAQKTEENFARKNKSDEEFTTYERLWARRRAKVVLEREKAVRLTDSAAREKELARLDKEEQNLQNERYTRVKKEGWFSDSYETQVNPMFKDADSSRLDRVTAQAVAERRKEEIEATNQSKKDEAKAEAARQNAYIEEEVQKQRELKKEEKAAEEKKKAQKEAESQRKQAEAEKEFQERSKKAEQSRIIAEAEESKYKRLSKDGPVSPTIRDQHNRDMNEVKRLEAELVKEQNSRPPDPTLIAKLHRDIRDAKRDVIDLNDKAKRQFTPEEIKSQWKADQRKQARDKKRAEDQLVKKRAAMYMAVAKATGSKIPTNPDGFIKWKAKAIEKLEKTLFLSGKTEQDIQLLQKYGVAPETAKLLLRPMDPDLGNVLTSIMRQETKGGAYKYSGKELDLLRMSEDDIVKQREKMFKGSARDRLDAQLKEKDRRRLEVAREQTLIKTLKGTRAFENMAAMGMNANPTKRAGLSNNLMKKLASQGIINARADDASNATRLKLLNMNNVASLLYPNIPAGNPNIGPRPMNSGGVVYASTGKLINFEPKGTDTVPAMLTPGEFVVNARSTAQHLPLLKAINKSDGGTVQYLRPGGPVHRPPAEVDPKAPSEDSTKKAKALQDDLYGKGREAAIREIKRVRFGFSSTIAKNAAANIMANANLYDIFNPGAIQEDIDTEALKQKYLELITATSRQQANATILARINYLTNVINSAKQTMDKVPEIDRQKSIHGKTLQDIADVQREHARLELEKQQQVYTLLSNPNISTGQWQEVKDEKPQEPDKKSRGGMIYAAHGTLVPYKPRGTDTVPAMLTPGEFVVNARSTRNNLSLLNAINRQRGGIAYMDDGGVAGGGTGGSSGMPGIAELNMFKNSLMGTVAALDKLNSTLGNMGTASGGGVSNNAGSNLSLDGLTAFTQKFGEFTVALGKINPIINMKGEHNVNVNINGMESFKNMKQEFQDMILSEVQKAMEQLSANTEGAIPPQKTTKAQE